MEFFAALIVMPIMLFFGLPACFVLATALNEFLDHWLHDWKERKRISREHLEELLKIERAKLARQTGNGESQQVLLLPAPEKPLIEIPAKVTQRKQ